MTSFKKLGVLASAVSALTVAPSTFASEPPAKMVLEQSDNAYVTFKRSYDATLQQHVIVDAFSHAPELLEVVGEPDCVNASAGECILTLRLHKNGPVNLNLYDTSGFLPYGVPIVDELNNEMSVDFSLWGFNRFFIASALTQHSNSPSIRGNVTRSQGSTELSNTNVNERDTYIEIKAEITHTFLGGQTSDAWQTIQLIASATDDKYILFGLNTPEEYITTDGNKGIAGGNFSVEKEFYAFRITHWNDDQNGHYGALRFLTNGESDNDPGLNLEGYTTVTANLGCADGLVYEVFVGNSEKDSAQVFLDDIHCDGTNKDHTFTIPESANLSDIQTGMWFNLTTGKNPTNINYDIYMNVWSIEFNK